MRMELAAIPRRDSKRCQLGVTGLEPATYASQTHRSSQTELHPARTKATGRHYTAPGGGCNSRIAGICTSTVIGPTLPAAPGLPSAGVSVRTVRQSYRSLKPALLDRKRRVAAASEGSGACRWCWAGWGSYRQPALAAATHPQYLEISTDTHPHLAAIAPRKKLHKLRDRGKIHILGN